MKIYQKILVSILWVTILGWIIFAGLNYYEQQYNCILGYHYTPWEENGIFSFECRDKERLKRSEELYQQEKSMQDYADFEDQWDSGKTYERNAENMILKPLILLYPTKPTHVDVRLDYDGEFTATFPEYSSLKKGWSVEASPESIIQDKWTGQETYGLFWEGKGFSTVPYDMSHGFVMKWSEVREFLYATLRSMNLSPKEYSDFIMFWYPKLQDYPYVQITFAGKDYTDRARLTITPTPDNIFRVFMVAKPLDTFQEIPPQKIERFNRTWFHVLEWGGTIVQ